ncbi:NADase-type glycan-binding domain-containing protein [Streptomyces milbemycinicus]|uniref:NADase-type glycan-binding domain-containing protein n=1 Tax=Streptomyces milbemycinicus TaxID=476552 RepID=UPI0033CCF349
MICTECGHRNAAGAQFCASCQAFLEWEREGAPPEPTAAPRRPGDPLDGPPDAGPDHQRPESSTAPATPATPATPPVPPRPDVAPRRPGRPCPRCRADTPYDRRLCVRCGALLDVASAPAANRPLPWWRRIFRRGPQRPLTAGDRPRLRSRPRPRLLLPVVLLVLAAAAWFGRGQLSELFTFTQDRTSDPKPLHADQFRGSSQAPGHTAHAAFDGYNNKYWAPATGGPADGQYLEADFDQPVRLLKLLITSGSSAKEAEFLTQARPSELTVTLVSSEGKRSSKTLKLNDKPGQQTFDVPGTEVTRVRLTVGGAYGVRSDRRVAIAEVEFFGRR